MKLTDLIYRVTSQYREIENFARHPFQILEQRTRRMFQDRLEEIEIPNGQSRSKQSEQAEKETRPKGSVNLAPELPNESSCRLDRSPMSLVEKPPLLPDVPLLSEQNEIRGRWGRYRRVGEVIKIQPHKRLYNGILVLNDKPILIQEYLLSEREFNTKEVRERKEIFGSLTGLNLRNGDGQDFRLVNPWDAIASTDPNERRCYLITEPVSNSCTLRELLTRTQTSLSAKQVRQVLNQVLQTLWFLHNQKLRLPSSEVLQGLAHGNLSLDSLLYVQNPQYSTDELQFLIYVTDLALWEHLFEPPYRKLLSPTFAQDLIDLGHISWQLLIGKEDCRDDRASLQTQPISTDVALQQFVQQLIRGEFRNDAEEAWKALLRLPPENTADQITSTNQLDANKTTDWWGKTKRWRTLLLLALLASCLGGLLWLSWRWLLGTRTDWMTDDRPNLCCLANVPDIPSEPITYAVEQGIWSDVLQEQFSVAYGKTLEQEIKRREPRLEQYIGQLTTDNAIAEVQSGRAEFALTEWRNDLPTGLIQQEVAFDGLAIVVAYSDAKRAQNIPEAFQGKISFDQLRQLYGSDRQWEAPQPLQGWKTKRYVPDDSTAIKLFKQRVLNNNAFNSEINQTSSNKMFGAILKNFETDQTLGIGFVRLSKALEQCSVYPLAIAESNQPIQAFVQDDGKPITPNTDLCNDKGSYWLNPQIFNFDRNSWRTNYPLVYRLVVVYRQNSKAGERFATALKTDEGQALLAATGLVPMRTLNR